jgi:hypothetical protein
MDLLGLIGLQAGRSGIRSSSPGKVYNFRFPISSPTLGSTQARIRFGSNDDLLVDHCCLKKVGMIQGFHGGDYEEWRLLGYKNPVRTSHETHYVSAIEPSRLMLCKIWGFHGGDYEERLLLGYKYPVHTSHETHYVSAIETSRLILYKIWGFHGGDYEEWRLLGYKNLLRTSPETQYVSAIEPNRLRLCKIWGFHGGDYEECYLLECYAVWLV